MKEKILSLLIAKCKDLTGVSKRTLEVVADKLAKTVTEETSIEAAIDAEMPSLKSFQGNLHHNEAQAVQTYVDANPVVVNKTQKELDEAEAARKLREEKGLLTKEDVKVMMAAYLKEQLDPLQNKITEADEANAVSEMKKNVLNGIKKEYLFNEEEVKRSNMAMRNILLQNPKPENSEKLKELWEAEYNTITTDLGLSSLKPIESKGGNDEVSSDLLEFKAKQQERGKLPKSDDA